MVLVPHVVKITLVNSLGLVAGTIVAVAILPQIYRVHRRRRGTDLSITRQVRAWLKFAPFTDVCFSYL